MQNAPDTLTPEAIQLANELLQQKDKLLANIHALIVDNATFGSRIRIHGDYHLGQLLRTTNDFLLVDFEGEPARTLEERRRKQSPLRDVAGMIRSFSYAAQSALRSSIEQHPEEANALESHANAWETAVTQAFINAYRETIAARPELLPNPQQAHTELQTLLLEKALYELLYELNNRPAWLPIPLKGLLAIARNAS